MSHNHVNAFQEIKRSLAMQEMIVKSRLIVEDPSDDKLCCPQTGCGLSSDVKVVKGGCHRSLLEESMGRTVMVGLSQGPVRLIEKSSNTGSSILQTSNRTTRSRSRRYTRSRPNSPDL